MTDWSKYIVQRRRKYTDAKDNEIGNATSLLSISAREGGTTRCLEEKVQIIHQSRSLPPSHPPLESLRREGGRCIVAGFSREISTARPIISLVPFRECA